MNKVTMAQAIPSIPIEINPFTHGIAVSKTTLYLNATDSHYHLKGLVQNILQVTVDSISLYTTFQERSTGTQVHTVPTIFINGPIKPNQTVGFDIDTGYTASQVGELQHLKAMIT